MNITPLIVLILCLLGLALSGCVTLELPLGRHGEYGSFVAGYRTTAALGTLNDKR